MRNPEVDAVRGELEATGISSEVDSTGKHIRISWAYPNGEARYVVVGATPSDWRGRLNARALVRRMLRTDAEKGLLMGLAPRILERALKAPTPQDTSAERLLRLEADVGGLLDLVTEADARIAELSTKLASLQVTVSFGADQPAPAKELGVVAQPPTKAVASGGRVSGKSRTYGERTHYAKILRAMPAGTFVSVAELRAMLGMSAATLSSYLQDLRVAGDVENGLRGYWRKVPTTLETPATPPQEDAPT